MLNGKAIDDDVALTALIALHSVNADIHQGRNAQDFYFATYHGYLISVGHYDAYAMGAIKPVGTILPIEAAQQVSHHLGFRGIHFV